MRLLALLLMFLVASSGAAKHKKPKKHKSASHAKVTRTAKAKPGARAKARAEVVAAAPAEVRTGNAELDRILRDRPAPEAWTDSILSIPAPSVARVAPSEVGTPWTGETPAERLRSVAERWLGTRYRTGGNGENGLDCSGFVNRVLLTFGIHLAGRSSPSFWTQGEKVEQEDLQPGDMVFFSDGSRFIGHVGLYLENGTFMHASVAKGVMVSALDEKYYRRRYKGARRIPALSSILAGETSGPYAFR